MIVACNALYCTQCIVVHPCVTHLLDIFYLKLQRFTFSGIMWIVCYCHLALFYLWHHLTMGFCNLFWNAICEVWIGWIMTDGRNFRLIVASNALWCAHVSPIYWTFFHLKLQRFTFNGILWIIYCCHLALFYLWYHHMLGICNLFCDTMCDIWIGWTMTDCRNLRLIVKSNVLWCAQVSTIYWTFCH